MIEECFQPALQERAFKNVWSQQNGTTAHRAHISMDVLRLIFPGRLFSLQGDIASPARSPDLKPCDHLLWGYLKAKMLKCCPRSLQGLKQATCEEVQRIPQVMLKRVAGNFRVCLQQRIDNQGHNLSDILYKTK